MRNLFEVLERPLAGTFDRHPPLTVDVADAGLGLQVGMFLVRELVVGLDRHRRLGPPL